MKTTIEEQRKELRRSAEEYIGSNHSWLPGFPTLDAWAKGACLVLDDLAEAEAQRDEAVCIALDNAAARDHAIERADAAEKALSRYGAHVPGCAAREDSYTHPCDCGLVEAYKGLLIAKASLAGTAP